MDWLSEAALQIAASLAAFSASVFLIMAFPLFLACLARSSRALLKASLGGGLGSGSRVFVGRSEVLVATSWTHFPSGVVLGGGTCRLGRKSCKNRLSKVDNNGGFQERVFTLVRSLQMMWGQVRIYPELG